MIKIITEIIYFILTFIIIASSIIIVLSLTIPVMSSSGIG